MGNAWIRDAGIITLIAVTSILIILPVQLLLCFKVKKRFLRLLPPLVLTAATVFFLIMMRMATDWSAIGYAILGVFSGVLLISSGIAWGIWSIIKLIKRKKNS